MIYSRKIKWKLLLSITGNEYQKTLFGTGIKASPGIGQRKTEKRTLFWKMQQLRWNKEIWKGVCVNVNIKMIKKWKIKMYIFQDLFLSLCFHKGSFFF